MSPQPPDIAPVAPAVVTREEALLRPVFDLVRKQVDGSVSAEVHAAGLLRLQEARAAETQQRRPTGLRWTLVGSLSLAAAIAAAVGLSHLLSVPAGALSYQVESGLVGEGGYIQPAGSERAIIRFSDGSEVDLGSGGRGRVAGTSRNGARIAIENGLATVHVVHRPSTRWSVEAGPFAIQVTGTSFDVQWSGAEQELRVDMHTGSIVIRGPLATEGIAVRGGQRLIASLRDGQIRIEKAGATASSNGAARPIDEASARTNASGAASPGSAPGSVAGAAVDLNGASSISGRGGPAAAGGEGGPSAEAVAAHPAEPSRAVPGTAAGWTKRVAAGDFRGVLAEAKERGLATSLVQAPLADLVALADAARYAGDTSVARRALLSQRTRFPSSPQARGAAFLLGRLVEDSGGSAKSAIDWYDRYLAEAPQGSFASEALGRKLTLVQRTSGTEQAHPIAVEYLKRFPHGAYASLARELLRGSDGAQ